MANVIKLRKGLDINLKGKAAETYATVKEPGFYALEKGMEKADQAERRSCLAER